MKKLYQMKQLKCLLCRFLSLSSFSSLFFLMIACSAPKGLIGVWEAEHQECLFKDKSGIFKNTFTKERRYILDFKGDKQVKLIYQDLNIFADFFINKEKQTEKENLQCDVVFTGTYSYYPVLGSIQFNFANDETGAYQIKKGESCGTDLKIEFTKMPAKSPYLGDPEVLVKKVGREDLYLAFSNFPKCENDKMITVFRRK